MNVKKRMIIRLKWVTDPGDYGAAWQVSSRRTGGLKYSEGELIVDFK
jgi:hypothetical protein